MYDYDISPESVTKARPKCYVPELTAAPLDVLVPLILNAPYDFINTQFTDEVIRARKKNHIEKKARKYYAEIVFQVNLYRLLPEPNAVAWNECASDDRWFSTFLPTDGTYDPEDEWTETLGRVIDIEHTIGILERYNVVTAEDFIILEYDACWWRSPHRFKLTHHPRPTHPPLVEGGWVGLINRDLNNT